MAPVPCMRTTPAADKIMAMEQLAADTGGKAFFNTNDLNGATQKAIADGAHYYTIAYSPKNKKMDGGYRQIKIKIPDTKYKLAYRPGYNADDVSKIEAKANADPLREQMLLGMPNATQLLYGLRVIPAVAPAAGQRPARRQKRKADRPDHALRSRLHDPPDRCKAGPGGRRAAHRQRSRWNSRPMTVTENR